MTPKARAHAATLVVEVPFLLLLFLQRELLSMRGWLYLAVLSFLASVLIYQWVYHRQVAGFPAAPAPAPELNLATERLPRWAWLAIGPPLIVVALLLWVTAHGGELPWRQRAPGPFGGYPSYRFFLGMMIILNGVATWMFVRRLAEWWGMSRAYQSRRALLLTTMANQWVALVHATGCAAVTAFMLVPPIEWVFAIAGLGGGFAFFWTAKRVERLAAANPRTGQWFYVDSLDPAFLGPRGLNLANAWSWVLAAGFVAPIVLVEWMLHRLQGIGQ